MKTRKNPASITLQVPQNLVLYINLIGEVNGLIKDAHKKFVFLFGQAVGAVSSSFSNIESMGTGLKKAFPSRPNFPTAKTIKKVVPLVILAVVLLVIALWIKGILSNNYRQTPITNADGRIDVKPPKAVYAINQEFSFPIKDEKGKEITSLKYKVTNAELRDEIIVRGQKYYLIKGRTYLIVNIELTNKYNRGIDINAKDFIRLAVNGDKSHMFAADIHNDPVTVQAISTKVTRLGFPINDSDKNLELQVGELSGSKKAISLRF